MKTRPLQLILAATLIGFILYVYNFPPNQFKTTTETPPAVPISDSPTDVGTEKDTCICLNYKDENMSTLDADLVHQMTEDYRYNQWKFINTNSSSKTINDAYSIWFDIETLKKFLYHIEKISKKQDPSIKNDQLGVRIYYAAYPDREIMAKYPDDLKSVMRDHDMMSYSGLHTLVMIPTISNKNGEMLDFNPLDSLTYASGLSKIDKYTKNHPDAIPNNTAALSGTSTTSRRTSARNHGILYPPTGALTAPSALGF